MFIEYYYKFIIIIYVNKPALLFILNKNSIKIYFPLFLFFIYFFLTVEIAIVRPEQLLAVTFGLVRAG